jgi:hypothetical protein
VGGCLKMKVIVLTSSKEEEKLQTTGLARVKTQQWTLTPPPPRP